MSEVTAYLRRKITCLNSEWAGLTEILNEARSELAKGFSGRLSWTHYRVLLSVNDPAARDFYEIEAERESWSTPHLARRPRGGATVKEYFTVRSHGGAMELIPHLVSGAATTK